MDIIKSILHVFKKSDNAFKIMHPETESAQITDWNQGIVNTLASTALGSLVNTLTSDSLLAKMIQKVLTATGVKYSMGQNGYICLGSLFGGLIIQWGKNTLTSNGRQFTFPLTSSSGCFVIFASDRDNGCDRLGIVPDSRNAFVCWNKDDAGQFTQSDFSWIALCI